MVILIKTKELVTVSLGATILAVIINLGCFAQMKNPSWFYFLITLAFWAVWGWTLAKAWKSGNRTVLRFFTLFWLLETLFTASALALYAAHASFQALSVLFLIFLAPNYGVSWFGQETVTAWIMAGMSFLWFAAGLVALIARREK